MRRASILWLLLAVLVSGAGSAQVFKYLAFGDSITEGFNDHPACLGCGNPAICGYPSRLSGLLGCNGANCLVVNHGLSFETTGQGITRLNNIFGIDPNWDALVLMEGSNDLWAKPSAIPEETVRDNLKRMAYDAAERDVDTVHTSIIRFHYLADHFQFRDGLVDNLGNLILALAVAENRYFADPRATLCGTLVGAAYQNCQNTHYCEDAPGNPDPWIIGHPGPSGFDLMAQVFSNAISAAAAPGPPTLQLPTGDLCAVAPTVRWTRESPAAATWYQVQVEVSGAGTPFFDTWVPAAPVSAIAPDPPIPGACSGSACSVTLPSALAPGNYVWRVRGRNPRGRSAWTADMPFDGKPIPGNGFYPAGSLLDLAPTTPTYRWAEAPGATGYVLGGTIPPTSTAGFVCSGLCTVKPATPDLPQGNYNWTVTPSNSCGTGAASAPVAFSVDACAFGSDLILQNATVNGPASTSACGTIRAGNLGLGDYTVGATGDLTAHAGVAAELHDGFSVLTGGQLTVVVDY